MIKILPDFYVATLKDKNGLVWVYSFTARSKEEVDHRLNSYCQRHRKIGLKRATLSKPSSLINHIISLLLPLEHDLGARKKWKIQWN